MRKKLIIGAIAVAALATLVILIAPDRTPLPEIAVERPAGETLPAPGSNRSSDEPPAITRSSGN